ncbi:hsp70-binding protein 1 [Cimex lectularius]|uniref:Nucleotide exchange factor Fes1 domain-containing protein n=1 Tax=Cimex lectularius TaxID=79782 RepID=A0A8I6RQI8_CIMLE|nr:hsp70-binding protein 1 [Cimex lectularius]
MSSNGNQGGPNQDPPLALPQPRQPRNLQDLLRFAVESNDGNAAANSREPPRASLDPESREFISNALRALSVDVTKELLDAINVLKTLEKYDQDPLVYENAFVTITDHIDNIDAANDFVKLGGFDIATSCLSTRHAEVRWRMADVLAQCAQNNPFCQLEALKRGFLPIVLKMTDSDRDEKCKIKAFFAASNIVRTCEPALEEFIKVDGFSVVLRAMESNIERLENKATFFLSAILSENSKLVAELIGKGFIEQLINMIKKEHSPKHEHMVSALLTITKNSTTAENECRRQELNLLPHLTKILNTYGHEDTFKEEINYIKDLILLVFPEDPDVER